MILEFVSDLEAAISSFSETIYTGLAADLAAGLASIAALILVVMLINAVIQVKSIPFTAYFGWIIRVVIVIAMATSWSYFEPIYTALNTLPDALLGAISGGDANAYQAVEDISARCMAIGGAAMDDASFISIGGATVWIIGLLLGMAGIVIATLAKVGLAISLGLAPLFIATLLHQSTAQYFGTWSKFVIGFVLIQVMLALVMSTITFFFDSILTSADDQDSVEYFGQLALVCLVALALVAMIPSMATALSGSISTGVTGFAQAAALASGAAAIGGAAATGIDKGRTGGAMGGAMLSAFGGGDGFRDSVGRAMQARKDIQKGSFTRSTGARVRDAAAANFAQQVAAKKE